VKRLLPQLRDTQSWAGALSTSASTEAKDGARDVESNGYGVAVTSMPFVSIRRPSIQVGLLVSLARSHGFRASGLNLNLDFAHLIGVQLYERLCEHRGLLIGEWLFALEAFGKASPDPNDDFCELMHGGAEGAFDIELLKRLRREVVPKYLDDLVRKVAWDSFEVVGFTSTFQQNTPSIALARRLRERYPRITLVVGGANLEGQMGAEFMKAAPQFDFAVSGEGDRAFTALLTGLHENRDLALVPNLLRRNGDTVSEAPSVEVIHNLDDLPIPTYTEYFDRAESLGLLPDAPRRDIDIPFESARGCWWGAKHHCTFCGLNGNTMQFRSKSPHRVARELAELAAEYRSFRFEAVDNILDHKYFDTLLPVLSAEEVSYDIFFEVKSNLSRADLLALYSAGVTRIQPGIESLSSPILKLMRKGVTSLQNINTLRWAQYYGIRVYWNLLWGFPNERLVDYHAQLQLLNDLGHLQPPVGSGRIWLERYSPLFTAASADAKAKLKPIGSYRFIYPASVNLSQIAYFFDGELADTLPDEAHEPTRQFLTEWQGRWAQSAKPCLEFRWSPDFIQIEDRRSLGTPGTYTFEGGLARLYKATSDRPLSVAGAAAAARLTDSLDEVRTALDLFCERSLMAKESGQYLSLALPVRGGR
jgi:ribosomal peptide maturation radical SAM protein 1